MPDRPVLDVDRLRAGLGPRFARVRVVAETGSTNADLLAAADAPARTVLAAEVQTGGRGRLDRTWASPPSAGLTVSVLVRPEVPILRWGWLPLLTGVALCEAVTEVTGVPASLKWPNDLLAGAGPQDGRKLAGILVQTRETAAVVGIGLNVSTAREELPVDTATSLVLCGAADVDRTALLVAILRRFDARYSQWADVEGDAAACGLVEAYRQACSTLGTPVRVSTGDATLTGTAVDVDDSGRLVVERADGERRPIAAGDVEHVR